MKRLTKISTKVDHSQIITSMWREGGRETGRERARRERERERERDGERVGERERRTEREAMVACHVIAENVSTAGGPLRYLITEHDVRALCGIV